MLPFKLTTVGGQETDIKRFKILNVTNVKMSETHFEFKANFTDSEIISMGSDRDRLQLTIQDPTYFQSVDGEQIQDGQSVMIILPPQLP